MNANKNIILGIDPGSTIIGYGVISCIKNKTLPLAYGYIDLKSCSNSQDKLIHLYKDLNTLIKKYKPNVMALESLFYFKNAKTIVPVLQSRGVILLSAGINKLKTYEYTPLQVKQIISGYGKADKSLVQKLVKSTLNLEKNLSPDDVSDALAIAICHSRYLINL